MKKLLFCFLLFTFQLLTLRAQDTIVLNNGGRIGAKVISVTDEVTYKLSSDTTKTHYYNLYKVSYIKYAGGFVYTVNRPDLPMDDETIGFPNEQKRARLYLLASAGGSFPFHTGYGSMNSYYTYNEIYGLQYGGFASNGLQYSITGGIKFNHGVEMIVEYSYYQHSFDASDFLNGNMTGLDREVYIQPTGNYATINSAYTPNTYYYDNSSFLVGIAKNWHVSHYIQFGMNMLGGQFITNMPAVQGYCGLEGYVNGNNITTEYNLYTGAKQDLEFVFELGIHADVVLLHHLMLRAEANMQLSSVDLGTDYRVIDAYGNLVSAGPFTQDYYGTTKVFLGLGNLTLGLGYEL